MSHRVVEFDSGIGTHVPRSPDLILHHTLGHYPELLEELNRKEAVYPGTNLMLVYELPPNRAERAKPGSNTLNRCKDV